MTERIGPYELLNRLGQGGMGEVFLARLEREQGFEKLLAVKRILPALSGTQHFQDLFAAEARLTAGLNHPNIVQVVDFGSQAGACYLVMEYVDGADLASLTAGAIQGLPLDASLGIGLACAQALGHAHGLSRPVIHGDVCAANVLIGRAGEVKLTDFGLARLATEPGQRAAGHPAAMAPEVAAGAPPHAFGDQFGLGATLLELVTGQPAYPPRASATEALELARRAEIRKATELEPDLHPGLAAVIDRALAADPAQRFPDLDAMEDALERIRQGLGLAAGPRPIAQAVADRLPAANAAPKGAPRGGTLVSAPTSTPPDRGAHGRGWRLGLLGVLLVGLATSAWWFLAGPGAAPEAVPPPAGVAGLPRQEPLTSPRPAVDLDRLVIDSPQVPPEPSGGRDPEVRRAPKAAEPIPNPPVDPPVDSPTDPEPQTDADPQAGAWVQVPDIAGWSLDGSPVQAVRQDLGPGGHLLRMESPDGLDARVRVEIPAQPGSAGLSVQSSPYAILHLDGRPRGTTPIAGLRLAPGEHEIGLATAGDRKARLELKLNVP